MKLNFLMGAYDPSDGSTVPIAASRFATRYLDLSQVASIVNRRFYRQGLNWAVSNIQIQTPNDVSVVVQKLPNTWVMSNAWEKGFRAWQKMNKEALVESESVRPKFLDFKIYADNQHHQYGFGANLLPYTRVYNTVAQTLTVTEAFPGEWESSKYIIPDTTSTTGGVQSREIIATGASYPGASSSTGLDAVSLIEGYAASRALPNIVDPNTPDDAADANGLNPENFLAALHNDGTLQTDEVLGDMITENNLAPYPFENDGIATDTQYPGGANQMAALEIHAIRSVTSTTIGGTTNIEGGNFPCGLIAITGGVAPGATATTFGVEITLVPGQHRGYLCEPMTEM